MRSFISARNKKIHWPAALVLGLTGVGLPAAATVSLPAYNVDISQTTVSGISSGGYMTTQFAVAHSAIVKGVGIVAGGPYDCANGSVSQATGDCMSGSPGAANSINLTNSRAASGLIDATSNLAKQKVHLFRGYNDGVIRQGVTDAVYSYYSNYTSVYNIMYKNNTKAGHTLPTISQGNACEYTGSPFISNCNYDWAGSMLQHLHGQLNPRNAATLSGQIIEFAQSDFVAGNPWLAGMSYYGYAYVPASCSSGAECKVHVSFHGCKQSAAAIGTAYYTKSGLNEYADTNNMIVLYPQTVATTVTPLNPNGCWDWWGYGSTHYADKQGPQIAAVRAMLNRLAGNYRASVPPLASFGAPANLAVGDKTHNRVELRWSPVSGAAGYKVYRATAAAGPYALVNAAPNPGPSFVDGGRAASNSYYYAVSAVNAAGGESAASAVVAATTAATPNSCDPWHGDNYSHTVAGRAFAYFGFAYAWGSGNYMGPWTTYDESQLTKIGANYYVGTCS